MRRPHSVRTNTSYSAGESLLETIVIVAIIGIVAVIFITGVTISSRAAFISDEQATAASIARSQMEWALNAEYVPQANSYNSLPLPDEKGYTNYSANISAQAVHQAEDGIQKITVTILHSSQRILTLEGYKTNR